MTQWSFAHTPYAQACLAEREAAETEVIRLGRSVMEREMTAAEIESQFESEWVLVEDPQTDENLRVLSGRVLHHSKDRDEVYRKAIALRPKRFAMLYTGEIPAGTELLL